MIRTAPSLLFLFLLFTNPFPAQQDAPLWEHLRFLASDELRGRGNGTEESRRAALYIAGHFRKWGLIPLGAEENYLQSFRIGAVRYFGANNRLAVRSGESLWELRRSLDYDLIGFSNEVEVEAPLVFAGYGISAPEYHYDDYAKLDVTGRFVVLMEHEPQEFLESRIFDGRNPTLYSTPLYKILNARSRGARGVLLIPDRDEIHSDWKRRPHSEIPEMGIPALRLHGDWGERLLTASGRDPRRIRSWIDHHATPYSFEMAPLTAELSVDVVVEDRVLYNVIGLHPGSSPETVAVGAHYDHLGLGEEGSLAPHRIGEIHNGADDNASGTAALLELAQAFSGRRLPRGILFLAFAGEELGLLGSKYFTENPTLELSRIVSMINLDMIGRSQGNLMVGGVGTASRFLSLLNDLKKETPLNLRCFLTPNSPSDHLPFLWNKIPSLFFFTGLHHDYHRPEDDLEKLDVQNLAEVIHLVQALVERLASAGEAPHFVDIGDYHTELQPEAGTSRVRLGIVPDMEWQAGGVRLSVVVENSPAARAGLRPGDILLQCAERELTSLYDLTALLREATPGQSLRVVFLRRTSLIESTVVLEAKENG